MKKSMNEFGFENGLTLKQKFEMLRTAGFDAIEFNLSEAMSDKTLAEVNSLSKEYGIEEPALLQTTSGHIILHPLMPPNVKKPRSLSRCLSDMLKQQAATRFW